MTVRIMNKQRISQKKTFSLKRLKALVIKEFYQMIRDPSSLMIGFGLPLILMFIYGFGVSLDLQHLKIGVVLEDNSPETQSLVEAFTNSRYFDAKVVHDRRELTEDILSGAIRGFVVIPAYFAQFEKRPHSIAQVQVIADGSETNTANFVQNYVAAAWQGWLEQRRLEQGKPLSASVRAVPRFWYNEQLESRNILIPGSLAIIMALIGTLLTALVVAREWERGTMEALMSTPVHIVEIIIGKLVPYFVLGMSAMTLSVGIAIFAYNVPFRGSFLLLAFVSAVFLLTALEMGLLISTVTRNQFASAQAAIFSAFLPAFMLSGFIFEIASMPWPIRLLTHLLSARYFVSSLQTLFLVGNVWTLILHNLMAMGIIGAVLFIAIARNTKKRLD